MQVETPVREQQQVLLSPVTGLQQGEMASCGKSHIVQIWIIMTRASGERRWGLPASRLSELSCALSLAFRSHSWGLLSFVTPTLQSHIVQCGSHWLHFKYSTARRLMATRADSTGGDYSRPSAGCTSVDSANSGRKIFGGSKLCLY